ncbi:MAG: DUF3373 family protein [Desulfohalobiaceae bacterium]|nr:DUF3373 family protein [Desulfohalobiaceae bacterium]
MIWKKVVIFMTLSFMVLTGMALAQEGESQEKDLEQRIEELQQQVDELQKEQQEDTESLKERVSQTERHTAADKVELSVEMEPRLWSIHMQDARSSYGTLQEMMPMLEGNTYSDQEIQGMLKGIEPSEVDVDNDAVRTLRFRLRMDSQVNENLRFAGRLAAYKVWGDSVGINFNRAGMQDVSMDGTTASNPHGNTIRLERAYFVYDNEIGQVPWYISVGRRPSTEGPPLQYKKNLPAQGGSPMAHIINWEFDGASLHFDLSEMTGVPGADIKFCYGSAFESQYGTTSAFLSEPHTDDVDLYGVISDLYESYLLSLDTELKLTANYAYAPDITDGFTGLTVMPFTVSKTPSGAYTFEPNKSLYVSRMEPTTSIGDWQAGTLLLQGNTLGGALDLFLSGAWSHTEAENVSENPAYEMLGLSLLSSEGELEDHDGYSLYAGGRYNFADYGTKLGLEYNYGSKYWFNFTGAEDNLIGSKLATRGHVIEPYLTQNISGEHFFLRLGAQFYDFEYSGSGNPLGEPKDVDKVTGMQTTLSPVIDRMQQYYLSAVYRF